MKKVEGDFAFERAYCYYRLHDNEKAFDLVKDRTDEKCLELKAQILFRREEWFEAYEIYQERLRDQKTH